VTGRSAGVTRLYRLVALLVVGGRVPEARIDEMADVFGSLWCERAGRPAGRFALAARELAGLWRVRARLRRRGRGRSDQRSWTWRDGMGEAWRDLEVGLRMLLGTPVASLAAIVTLGLGIGGTTAVVTVAEDVLFDPMGYPEADELVVVFEQGADGSYGLLSHEDYLDLRAESRTLEAMGLFRMISVAVTGLGEPERIRGEFVTASYFDVLQGSTAQGRTIRPGEDVEGGDRTAVLSHGYWVRRFGADPGVLGRVIEFNNVPHTIVGVMEPGFRSYWDDTEAWISLQTLGPLDRGNSDFFGIGRLADGADLAAADRDLDGIMARLAEAYPDVNAGRSAIPLDLGDWVVGEQRRTLVLSLLGAVGMVLLIATANVANLQLGRASNRIREMAIRSALGGGRRRLLAQLLVENLTLAALGGAFGLGFAWLALRSLLTASFSPFSTFDVALSAPALAMAALLTVGAGTLAGIVPALRGSATAPAGQLREDGRSGSEGRRSGRFRSGLIVAQMAMAVTLLIGAGLLLRTTAALRGIDVGFDTSNLLTGETRLTAEGYQDDDARRVYLERVVEGLQTIPGTRGGTLVAGMPFSGDGSSIPARAEGSELAWEEAPTVFLPMVATGYFDLMGIPLLAGRVFERTDRPGAELVVVASRSAVDRFYPGENAVGRMLETPEGSGRIIGVVEDVRRTLTSEIEPTVYVHYLQFPPGLFSVLIRTEGRPESYERALREAFWSVDSNQPLWEVASLESRLAAYSSGERFLSALLGGFAGLALLLAAVGMYGVMAHGVGRRRHELGIRIALGAGRGRVLGMVLRQGVVLTLVGASVGLVGAAAVTRLLASVVYGVGVFDPLTFTVAPLVLIAVAALATYVPARRATRVDPVEAFRG
jgi:putative ABC transport system permease protein